MNLNKLRVIYTTVLALFSIGLGYSFFVDVHKVVVLGLLSTLLLITFAYLLVLNNVVNQNAPKNDDFKDESPEEIKLKSLEKLAQLKSWSFNRSTGLFLWGTEEFKIENWSDPKSWEHLFSEDFAFVLSQLFAEDSLIEQGLDILIRESLERGEDWFQLSGNFSLDSKTNLEGYAKEVSAIYNSQQALRTREENLDLALETGHLATWEWTLGEPQGQNEVFWMDPIWKTLIDWKGFIEDVSQWKSVVLPEDQYALKRYVIRLRNGTTNNIGLVFRIRVENNEVFHFKIQGKIAEKGRNGKALRFVGILQDVSQQKKGELEVVQLAESYRFLWDSNIVGLLIHSKGKIVDINQTLLDMLGWDREKGIGAELTEMIPESEKNRLAEQIRLQRSTFHTSILTRFGNLIPIEGSAKNIMFNGEELRLVMLQDISKRKQAESALKDSRAELQGTLEGMQDLILMVDPLGDVVDLAPTQGQRDYVEAVQWVGKNISEFTDLSLELFLGQLDDVFEGKKNLRIDFSSTLKGEPHFFRASLSRLSDEVVIVVCNEQTAVVQAMEQIQESEARFKGLADLAEEMVIFHENGEIVDANNATQRKFRLSEKELLGKSITDLVGEEDYTSLLMHIANDNPEHLELTGQRDGVEFPIQAMAKKIDKINNSGVIILNDITERKKIEEKLKYMATYDALTNLPNRVLFTDRLQRAVLQAERSKHRVSVFLLDLDGFKSVNDTKGHQAGDELLIAIGERLNGLVRKNDTVARMGGDEFAFLLPGIEEDESALLVAEKIIKIISEPIQTSCGEVRVSGSIGISFFPDNGKNVDTVYKAADMAMYQSKEAGKHQATLYREEHGN